MDYLNIKDMTLYDNSYLTIYFGTSENQIDPKFLHNYKTNLQELDKIKQLLNIDNLIFLKQIHSDYGLIIPKSQNIKYFDSLESQETIEGDFIITNKSNIGISVYTADCLPIIFFDNINLTIAIAHAGWQGSVKTIAIKTLESMQSRFGTDLNNIKIFFGPSAQSCCYEIKNDFIVNIKKFSWYQKTLIYKNNKIYFDLVLFNKLMLQSIGLKEESFNLNYNQCTICNEIFCSYRRDRSNFRQLTIVSLSDNKF